MCETALIYTTFAFDNLFRVLAVFPKMKGFYMKAETIKVYWNRPDFALVWQEQVVVLSHSVYEVSLTNVHIKSLLPCITLVAPMDYWLCVSVCLCISVFWR